MDRGFPRSCRIILPREFEAVMKGGFRAWTWNLIVFSIPNDLGTPRLGLAVSRKVGNAVARNRWKRLIREVFRNKLKFELVGRDFVVAVKAVPGFDRNRGSKSGGKLRKSTVKRVIPAIPDLEGELLDAIHRLNRKSVVADSAPDSSGSR